MASSSSSSTKLSMKLLIDTKQERVLFAEASKAVIDFIFNLLSLPIGTVVRLLTKEEMVGSLGNLYESVEKLNQIYMLPNQNKEVLLKPRAIIYSSEISGLLPVNDGDVAADKSKSLKFYACPSHSSYVTCEYNCHCPHYGSFCFSNMNKELTYVGKKAELEEEISTNKNGFVKEVVTYMVMDDLVIQPMSTISSITLLNKFNVKEIGVLEERVVELGMEEGIKLLKASLHSKMVLTSVFLKKAVNRISSIDLK